MYNKSNIKTDGKFYDLGIDLTDMSGQNQRSICHSAPIRKRTLVISDFIVIILASAVILILTAVVGGCYEFMLKYGECKDCIYYKSTCANMTTIGTLELYKVLSSYKIITALHKFHKLQDLLDYNKENSSFKLNPDYFMISTGISDDDYDNLTLILDNIDCKFI